MLSRAGWGWMAESAGQALTERLSPARPVAPGALLPFALLPFALLSSALLPFYDFCRLHFGKGQVRFGPLVGYRIHPQEHSLS